MYTEKTRAESSVKSYTYVGHSILNQILVFLFVFCIILVCVLKFLDLLKIFLVQSLEM